MFQRPGLYPIVPHFPGIFNNNFFDPPEPVQTRLIKGGRRIRAAEKVGALIT
jgi:hypothetical protein